MTKTMDIFLDIIGFTYQNLRVSVEKFEGVIKSHKSKKDRQCNDQKKKDEKTNHCPHNTAQKTKD